MDEAQLSFIFILTLFRYYDSLQENGCPSAQKMKALVLSNSTGHKRGVTRPAHDESTIKYCSVVSRIILRLE